MLQSLLVNHRLKKTQIDVNIKEYKHFFSECCNQWVEGFHLESIFFFTIRTQYNTFSEKVVKTFRGKNVIYLAVPDHS